jgi:HAD superfamily hydrolase (TIGR01509 family)
MLKDFIKNFEGIVFDLNGTILKDEFLWHQLLEDVFGDEIISFPKYYGKAGLTLKDNIDLILEGNTFKNKADLDIYYKSLVTKYFQKLDPSYIAPGFIEFATEMRRLGKRMALATNADKYITQTVIGKLDLTSYFEFMLTSEDVANPKPAPDIFEYSVVRFGLPKSKVLVFEDSLVGNYSAEQAGLERFIIIPDNLNESDYGSNTKYFFKDYYEIIRHLDSSPQEYLYNMFEGIQ